MKKRITTTALKPCYVYAVLGDNKIINIDTVHAYTERHRVPCDYQGDYHYTPEQVEEMVALDRASGLPLPPPDIVAEALDADAKLFAWTPDDEA
jgi:hypothetical protein